MIKRKIKPWLFIIIFMCMGIGFIYAQSQPSRLVDNASLLSDSEKVELETKLDSISKNQECDVVILSTKTLEGKSTTEYADDFYDYNNYGIGENKSGVLLLINMEERDWYISTCGFGITAFTDAGIEYIGNEIKPYLKDSEYSKAFETYAELCDKFITQAKTGEPYDNKNLPKKPFTIVLEIVISIAIGIAIAFTVGAVMKSQLKTVKRKAQATDYVDRDSLNITNSNEMFIFSRINRTAKPKEGNSGSSTHQSSSGTTHGGGGGKF